MSIPIPALPDIHPQVIPAQPDPASQFLQALLAQQQVGIERSKEQGLTSRSEMEHEARMAENKLRQAQFDFQVQQERTKQATLNAVGKATQMLISHGINTGAISGPQAADAAQSLGGMMASAAPGMSDVTPAVAVPQFQPSPTGPTIAPATSVSPSQVSSSKPSDGVDLLRQLPPDVFMGVLGQLSKVQEIRQQQVRDQIAAKYQAPPNESLPAMVTRLKKMSGEFAAANDHTMVASLAEDIGAIDKPEQYEWFQSKDGRRTVYLPKSEGSKLGLEKPIEGNAPVNVLPIIRSKAAILSMDQTHKDFLMPYELKVAKGQADLTDWDYFAGQLANIKTAGDKETGLIGHIVPYFSTATGASMMQRLNTSNPDLANYFRGMDQWAFEESQLTGRPSDYRILMDQAFSGIGAGARNNPKGIEQVIRSRAMRLGALKSGIPAIDGVLRRAAAGQNGGQAGVTITPDTSDELPDFSQFPSAPASTGGTGGDSMSDSIAKTMFDWLLTPGFGVSPGAATRALTSVFPPGTGKPMMTPVEKR